MAGNSIDAGRSVTSKVTAILMVFADDGVHTLTEIAGSAHLPTSTAHRLASELVAWRLLERTEERHYRIGLPLRIIASEYSESEVCSTTQTVMRALPMLDDLSRATRSEVRLGVLRGSQVLTLRPPTAARLRTHARCRGSCTVSYPPMRQRQAKHCSPSPRQASLTMSSRPGCPRSHRHTITSPDVLRRKLSVIRLTQIATSRNEFECGKAAIAMPIFYGGGRVAAAIELAVRDLGSRMEAGRRRAIRCVSQSLAPTGHRVSRDGKPRQPQRPSRVSGVNLPVLDQSAILGRARGGLSPDQAKDCLARHRRR